MSPPVELSSARHWTGLGSTGPSPSQDQRITKPSSTQPLGVPSRCRGLESGVWSIRTSISIWLIETSPWTGRDRFIRFGHEGNGSMLGVCFAHSPTVSRRSYRCDVVRYSASKRTQTLEQPRVGARPGANLLAVRFACARTASSPIRESLGRNHKGPITSKNGHPSNGYRRAVRSDGKGGK